MALVMIMKILFVIVAQHIINVVLIKGVVIPIMTVVVTLSVAAVIVLHPFRRMLIVVKNLKVMLIC